MNKIKSLRALCALFIAVTFGLGAQGAERAKATSNGATKTGTATKIDINTASRDTLESLPGVGPQTAQAIVASRPFASVDDLERVPGIGPAKMKDLKPMLKASHVTAKKETTTKPSAVEHSREPGLTPTGRTETRANDTRPAATSPAAHRVNLNTASRAELEGLPEIGPVKAQAIIDARPFTSVEDVMRVKGIKQQTFETIKDQITVR